MTPNEPTNVDGVTMNHDQRLYVIAYASGYSCLGYDVAFTRAASYANWANVAAPDPAAIGTARGYDDYRRCLDAALGKVRASGERCPCELEPALIGLEGARVEVTAPDGSRQRFWVGRSTGSIPVHLRIARSNCYGGPVADLPDGAVVRVIDRGPRPAMKPRYTAEQKATRAEYGLS